MRILFVTAMPNGQQLFHAGRKVRTLRARLAPLLDQGQVSLAVESAVRADQLQEILRQHQPHVLHVVCHATAPTGRKPFLALEDRRGARVQLDSKELYAQIKASGAPIKVVLLEACGSEPIAADLLAASNKDKTIVAVVGTRAPISATASSCFFLAFHELLAGGMSPSDAFIDARRDLELFAPGLWDLPVLKANGSARQPLVQRMRADSFGIGPQRQRRYARIASPLGPPRIFVGRTRPLRSLEGAWRTARGRRRDRSIVHVRGPGGVGKTALLARWLEIQSSRGYVGATRVFAWSFDPLAEGPACGGSGSFFDEALDFFGALEPVLSRGGAARHPGEWLEGMRLARIIRRERALLVLDGVPLLPHARGQASYRLAEVLPPGITALLLELARGQEGMCILSTRLDGKLVRFEDGEGSAIRNVAVGRLTRAGARELLGLRGAIGTTAALDDAAKGAKHHPLSLVLAAAAMTADHSPIVEALGSGTSLQSSLELAKESPESTLLSALELAGGSLNATDIHVLAKVQTSTAGPWEHLPEPWLEALRRLRRRGLISVTSRHTVELSHWALAEHIDDESGPSCEALYHHALGALGPRLEEASELPAFARVFQMGLRTRRVDDAVKIYVERICRRGQQEYQQSYLSRTLGLVADDLMLLGALFDPREALFSVLREDVAAADPFGGAFFFHRAGVTLRHLGRLRAAIVPLTRAFELYVDAEQPERAATCANDLGELYVSLHELGEALQWAATAAKIADKTVRSTKGHRGLLEQFLCHATLGHVHDLHVKAVAKKNRAAHERGATKAFAKSNKTVREFHTKRKSSKEFHNLFSRPGHQYWHFLFHRLEDEGGLVARRAEKLARLLTASRMWMQSTPAVAKVTQAYDALWRGRLLTLCAKTGQPIPRSLSMDGNAADLALKELFFAVHVLRANQYLWMLSEALVARAELFEVRDEQSSAKQDYAEAAELLRVLA